MSIDSVQDAFLEFEQTVARVPVWQNDRAKEVHPLIRAAVEAALGYRFERAFLAGSYARRVQAVRLKDVDIILVLRDLTGEFAASADYTLEVVRGAAKTSDLVVTTRKSVRAVKLDIDGEEFTVDLVPALPDPYGELQLSCRLPKEGRDDWTSARPQGQLDAATAKNQAMGGVFIPAVRIIKVWNQSFGEGGNKAMPSYLAESLVHLALDQEREHSELVVRFFREAQRHLEIPTPSVPCPGDPSNFVDQMLEDQRRERALARVTAALEHAEAAVAEPEPGKAMDCWANVFGPAFPAPSNDTPGLSAALRKGTARASGIGVGATVSEEGRRVIPARSWRQT